MQRWLVSRNGKKNPKQAEALIITCLGATNAALYLRQEEFNLSLNLNNQNILNEGEGFCLEINELQGFSKEWKK